MPSHRYHVEYVCLPAFVHLVSCLRISFHQRMTFKRQSLDETRLGAEGCKSLLECECGVMMQRDGIRPMLARWMEMDAWWRWEAAEGDIAKTNEMWKIKKLSSSAAIWITWTQWVKVKWVRMMGYKFVEEMSVKSSKWVLSLYSKGSVKRQSHFMRNYCALQNEGMKATNWIC